MSGGVPLAEPFVWVDGRLVDAGGPHVSALDRGFTLGDGVFETVRVYGGVPFRLGRHLERLARGARELGIPLGLPLERMAAAAAGLAGAAGTTAAGLRMTLTRGPGAPGLAPPYRARPTLVMVLQALPGGSAPDAGPGLALHTARARRNEYAATAGLKTLSYAESVLALKEARESGADDALLLDTEGHVSEAAASNIFVRLGGALVTPPTTCGALPGITRAAVLELAPGVGLDTVERPLAPEELELADEVLLTSSLREIAPVVRLDGKPVRGGGVGESARALMAAYAALVARECVG